MFTQTHLLIGAAVFARPGTKAVTAAGLAGAIVPDSDVWLMFVVERMSGSTGCEVFHYRYWEEPWTTLQSILNSIPLYAGMLILATVGRFVTRAGKRKAFEVIFVFILSSLIHVSTDFFLHHDDARAQWLPFADWVFRSPISYWDPRYYGQVFALFEIGLAMGLVAIIGYRYVKRSVWIMLSLAMLGYSGSVAASFLELADHDRGPGSCKIVAFGPKPIKLLLYTYVTETT